MCSVCNIAGKRLPALGLSKFNAENTMYPFPSMFSTVKSAGARLAKAGSMAAADFAKAKGPVGEVEVATTYPPALAQRMYWLVFEL